MQLGSYEDKISSKIILGLKLDDHSALLFKAACNLAHRLNAILKLVHVIEVDEAEKYTHLSMTQLGKELHDKDLQLAITELNRIRSSYNGSQSLRIETEVIRGADPAAILIAEAEASPQTLLMVGSRSHRYGWIPRGQSVVLSLSRYSPVPVLVSRCGQLSLFSQNVFKVLVMDDLTIDFFRALSKSLSLVGRLGRVEVLHAHVKESTVTGKVCAFTPLTDERPLPMGEVMHRWDMICLALQGDLSERWKCVANDLVRNDDLVRYEAMIVTESPLRGLVKLVDSYKPDLALMSRPPHLGQDADHFERVPLTTMLNKTDSLCILPP